MRAYGKEWDYNVYDCQYCLYWQGRKNGCVYEHGCCCPVPQKPTVRNGIRMEYPAAEMSVEASAPVSECTGCSYGRDSPCIGWCTKHLLRWASAKKECVT